MMKNKILILSTLFLISVSLYSCNNINNSETKNTANSDEVKQSESTIESKKETEETTSKNTINIKTDNLVKLMPNYKTELYSVAQIRKYNQEDIEKAYGEIVNVMNENVLTYNEKMIAYRNYGALEELTIAETMKRDRTKGYLELPKTDYIDYLKENDYIDKETHLNNIFLTVDLTSIKVYDLYYEYDGYFKKPVTINKDKINNLKEMDEDDAKIVINFPDKDGNIKSTMMYYDGDNGFIYYEGNESQQNMKELTIKPLNDKEYAFYRDDVERVNIIDKQFRVKVLKDSYIGIGTGYKQMVQTVEDFYDGFDDSRYLFVLEDLYGIMSDGTEQTPFDRTVLFDTNYYQYDERGYITNMYDITNEE